jgi:hypothetical protein
VRQYASAFAAAQPPAAQTESAAAVMSPRLSAAAELEAARSGESAVKKYRAEFERKASVDLLQSSEQQMHQMLTRSSPRAPPAAAVPAPVAAAGEQAPSPAARWYAAALGGGSSSSSGGPMASPFAAAGAAPASAESTPRASVTAAAAAAPRRSPREYPPTVMLTPAAGSSGSPCKSSGARWYGGTRMAIRPVVALHLGVTVLCILQSRLCWNAALVLAAAG